MICIFIEIVIKKIQKIALVEYLLTSLINWRAKSWKLSEKVNASHRKSWELSEKVNASWELSEKSHRHGLVCAINDSILGLMYFYFYRRESYMHNLLKILFIKRFIFHILRKIRLVK